MMRLKDYSNKSFVFFILLAALPTSLFAQVQVSGVVKDQTNEAPVQGAEVYITETGNSYQTDETGLFIIRDLSPGDYELIIFSPTYQILKRTISLSDQPISLLFALAEVEYELSAVVIAQQREELFALKRLRPVEGTAIYAGKKTEVVLMDQLVVNIAANNARQIYGQVTGLNIYESEDGGLQLNIGGRGLDPNRSANFNTRQNGYDISADVLGYPESYYTPPAEALSQIQVIRGAASLQYGTQFGGLINFKLKQPNPDKKIELISRQTIGSNQLFTSFNSLSGTLDRFSYYGYFQYKKGAGFRPNANFKARNAFAYFNYDFSEKTSLSLEFTYLNYLTQQAGGLTDAQFYQDPTFSNRSRNWFDVDWRMASLQLKHSFSPATDLSVNLFGLDASRKAVGFRTNRVSQTDDLDAPRDLLIGDFNNWGVETRLLTRYKIGTHNAIFLIGNKVYQSHNSAIQGPGTNGTGADFQLASDAFPFYANQSDFEFPNRNVAVFGENIFYLTDNFSLTPGFRFEYINTQSEGTYEKIDFDLAGNPIRDTTFTDNRDLERHFVLLGIGASYKPQPGLEVYGNISQNYRSVTFTDIRVVNPSFQIDPNISDEKGFTADIGIRGRFKQFVSYDIGVFGLLYDGRLGEVIKAETRLNASGQVVETGRVVRFRGNIGSAFMYGFESMIDWNLQRSFFADQEQYKLNVFVNAALTRSEYFDSEIPGVEGSEVEFIPFLNLKSGLRFGYKNLLGSLQYTYLSQQYTDASNAEQDRNDNQSGIRGAIPAYDILDLSLSYSWKMLQLETGINNLLNRSYFTRRATGYPGPGIIPSAPITAYLALQVKI